MNETILIRLSIYGIAALGVTLLLGCLRRFPLGFVVTLSVGAYVASCLRVTVAWPWSFCFAAGALAGGLVGALPALIDTWLEGDEYAVLWWMLAVLAYEAVSLPTLSPITGGQHSLVGIPPVFSGPEGRHLTAVTLFSAFLAAMAVLTAFRRSQAYEQASLSGLDPRVLEGAGQSVRWVSLKIHILGGILGGLAGSFWGGAFQAIHPSQFRLSESIVLLLICLVGGQGEPLGVAVGIVLVFLGPQLIDFKAAVPVFQKITVTLGLVPPDSAAVESSLYQGFLGVLLVLVIIYRGQGIVPALKRGRWLTTLIEAVRRNVKRISQD